VKTTIQNDSYLERFSDEARAQAASKIKHELLYGLAEQIGTGADLVKFWDNRKAGHESTELAQAHHEAARNLWEEGFIPECLPSVIEHWNANDWRGKKGQLPTPNQFFEEALKWRSALKRNGELFMKSVRDPEQVRTGRNYVDSGEVNLVKGLPNSSTAMQSDDW
jgi:hypothetical protein